MYLHKHLQSNYKLHKTSFINQEVEYLRIFPEQHLAGQLTQDLDESHEFELQYLLCANRLLQ